MFLCWYLGWCRPVIGKYEANDTGSQRFHIISYHILFTCTINKFCEHIVVLRNICIRMKPLKLGHLGSHVANLIALALNQIVRMGQ